MRQNITGKTPSDIVEMLTVYRDAIEIPFDNLPSILKAFDKSKIHLLVIGVKKNSVHIEYAESIQKIKYTKS